MGRQGRFSWTSATAGPSPRALRRLKELRPHMDSILGALLPIITPLETEISLRLLDWLVINYSKKNNIVLEREGRLIDVYDEYREKLRHWKRGLFDAFRRGPRLHFTKDKIRHVTTVAQLNFVHWCNQVGLMEYARKHRSTIEKDMNERIGECRKLKKQPGWGKKRLALADPDQPSCIVYRSDLQF